MKVLADRSKEIRDDLKEELQNESLKDEFKDKIAAALAVNTTSGYKLFGLLAEARGIPRILASNIYAQSFPVMVTVPSATTSEKKVKKVKKVEKVERVATEEAKIAVQALIQRLSEAKKKDQKGLMIEELRRYKLEIHESTDKATQKSHKRIERKVVGHENAIGEGRPGFSALKLLKFYAAELNVELSFADLDRVTGTGGKATGTSKKGKAKKGESKKEKDAKFAKQVWQAVAMGAASAREHLQELAKSGVQ